MEQNVTIPVQGILDCTHIQISANYDKGGCNYIHRGYYVTVKAVKIEPCKYGDFDMISFASDYPYKRYLVERAERKNPKKLAQLIESVKANAQAIYDAFIKGDYAKVGTIIAVA